MMRARIKSDDMEFACLIRRGATRIACEKPTEAMSYNGKYRYRRTRKYRNCRRRIEFAHKKCVKAAKKKEEAIMKKMVAKKKKVIVEDSENEVGLKTQELENE